MTDLPTLFQAAGQNTTGFLTDLLGTVAPKQSVRILTAYATEWMKGSLAGEVGGPLLEGQESEEFPEVFTVRKGNF
jgi:hypothetical protein